MNQIPLYKRDRIILDLCGGSGAWSKPYSDAGYDVRVITLPDTDVRDWIPPDSVYGILAAPPCTMFSLARNGHPHLPRDFKRGLAVVDACIRIIWRCKPVWWALENPVGMLSRWLGPCRFTFDPCDFSDPWTKKTALWGKFSIPEKKPIKLNEEQKKRCRENKRILPSINEITSGTQQEKRAVTPPGFAKAFFKVNQ